jgi:hypothetical protein
MELQFLLVELRHRKGARKKVKCLLLSGKLKHALDVVIVMEHVGIQHSHGLPRGDFEILGSHFVESDLKKPKFVPPLLQSSGKQGTEGNISLSGFVRHKKTIGMHILPPSNTFSSF